MLASEEDKCKAVICDNAVMPTGVKNGAALNRTARDAAPPDAWIFPLAQRSIFKFEHAHTPPGIVHLPSRSESFARVFVKAQGPTPASALSMYMFVR